MATQFIVMALPAAEKTSPEEFKALLERLECLLVNLPEQLPSSDSFSRDMAHSYPLHLTLIYLTKLAMKWSLWESNSRVFLVGTHRHQEMRFVVQPPGFNIINRVFCFNNVNNIILTC